jgi:hypothetical protein
MGTQSPNPVYRFHWERLAVNPHNPDGSLMGPSPSPTYCPGQPGNVCQSGGNPTATPTPTAKATTTATRTPTATPTSSVGGGQSVITFDDLANPNRPLSGQYPSGVIDWGTNAWWLSGPYSQNSTNSVSFNGAGPTSATFTFLAPRQLLQLDVDNGGTTSSTVSLNCPGQLTVQSTVPAGQTTTLRTNWSGTCASVTVSSTNGWNTNFDNLVIASTGVATATPTSTPSPTNTATPTRTPTPSGPTTVTFDDLTNPNRVLNGQYPTGLLDWGTNSWWLSGPYGKFTSNSVSFNGGGPTTESFAVIGSHQLLQLTAFNGGTTATTVTLSCAGQTTKVVMLTAGQLATIQTGWTGSCSKVTITSTNGWGTNFKNLVIQ